LDLFLSAWGKLVVVHRCVVLFGEVLGGLILVMGLAVVGLAMRLLPLLIEGVLKILVLVIVVVVVSAASTVAATTASAPATIATTTKARLMEITMGIVEAGVETIVEVTTHAIRECICIVILPHIAVLICAKHALWIHVHHVHSVHASIRPETAKHVSHGHAHLHP
jgi:peptidoglycan/LPS O-acetylase OafA/YrhL